MSVYTLSITEAAIDRAVCGDPNRCAISICGKEQTPLQKWRVEGEWILAFDPDGYVWHLWRMTVPALRAVKKFDYGDRACKWPKIRLDTDEAIMLPPYYNQGRHLIDLHGMDASRVEERAERQMREYRAGKRDYLAERKRERNERLRVDSGHIPAPLTDAQKQRNVHNRRFGSLSEWSVKTA